MANWWEDPQSWEYQRTLQDIQGNFGSSAKSPNWMSASGQPGVKKYDMSGNDEIDIFDVAEFAKNPKNWYSTLYGGYNTGNQAAPAVPATGGSQVGNVGTGNLSTLGQGMTAGSPTTVGQDDIRGLFNQWYSSLQQRQPYSQGLSESRLGKGSTFDPLIQKANTLFDQGPMMGQDYNALRSAVNTRALSGLQTVGYDDPTLRSVTQTPLDILRNEQQKALDLLTDQQAATGGYLTVESPMFGQFAREQVLEPFNLQQQKIISDAMAKGLELEPYDQQFASDAMGRMASDDLARYSSSIGALGALQSALGAGAQYDLADRTEERMRQGAISADDLAAIQILAGIVGGITGYTNSELDRETQSAQFTDMLSHDEEMKALDRGTLSDIASNTPGATNNVTVNTGSTTTPAAGTSSYDDYVKFKTDHPDWNWNEYQEWLKVRGGGASGGDPGGNRGDGNYLAPTLPGAEQQDTENAFIQFMLQNPDASWEEFMAWMKAKNTPAMTDYLSPARQ